MRNQLYRIIKWYMSEHTATSGPRASRINLLTWQWLSTVFQLFAPFTKLCKHFTYFCCGVTQTKPLDKIYKNGFLRHLKYKHTHEIPSPSSFMELRSPPFIKFWRMPLSREIDFARKAKQVVSLRSHSNKTTYSPVLVWAYSIDSDFRPFAMKSKYRSVIRSFVI